VLFVCCDTGTTEIYSLGVVGSVRGL